MTPAGKTILVVEDDLDLAKMMKRLLEGQGYRVLLAADGVSGVDAAVAERPDLILLDIKLPKLDGELVAVELRGRTETAQIPIIMVTAVTDLADKHLAAQLGALEYVEKPFESDQLLARIRLILSQKPAPA